MKKFIKKRPIFSFAIIVAVIFFSLISYFFYWAFYDIDRISKDELLTESTSPNGEYTVNIYSSNGGATVSNGVIGELTFNKKDKKRKAIYWNIEESASVEWINNSTVRINDKKLKVPNGKYDYRHD